MFKSRRPLTGAFAIVALVTAGCAGGSQSAVPSAGASLQSATQRASTANASVTQSLKISSLKTHGHEQDGLHIVAVLHLETANGNASWNAHDARDCSREQKRSDEDWDKGSIYTPNANETLAVPAFSMENLCRGHDDSDRKDGDGSEGTNFYVMMVTIADSAMNAVAGPGQLSGDDIAFPAANAPLALNAGQQYGFVLVRSDSAIPTPTPNPTPTPCSGKSCLTAG